MYIPYGKHHIDQDDIKAVVEALQASYITTGPKVYEFESSFAAYVGSKYAVAVSSGTAALHACCHAIGIKEGDEVITTPITFVASANCICYCGGKPVFADINSKTYNISPEDIEKKITKRTKAIIPVHFTGQPCDMEAIMDIANRHDLMIIEDAAHAMGAEYKGKKVGSISDLTIFSFHPVKHMTTCEGGMITTNNERLYKKLLSFRAYGLTKNIDELENKDEGPWYYEVKDLGYNYRLSDVMSALGLSQLKKIDLFVERRKKIAQLYNKELSGIDGLILPFQDKDGISSWHLYTIQIEAERRKEIYLKLKELGIGVDVHYLPVYRHPYYSRMGYQDTYCPNSEELYRQILSIPIFYDLQDNEQKYVVDTIRDLLNVSK